MTDMVDMKLSKEERKEMLQPGEPKGPQYPWGLSLSLDDDVLEKLGLDKNLPRVGDEVHLQAVAIVRSVSENQREGEEGECCVQLQITMLSVDDEGPDDHDDAKEENREQRELAKGKSIKTIASHYREA